tara:strand:- start:1644 stop:2810 length:1167 start_codon:yes stop_codon:yes gene_type:complete
MKKKSKKKSKKPRSVRLKKRLKIKKKKFKKRLKIKKKKFKKSSKKKIRNKKKIKIRRKIKAKKKNLSKVYFKNSKNILKFKNSFLKILSLKFSPRSFLKFIALSYKNYLKKRNQEKIIRIENERKERDRQLKEEAESRLKLREKAIKEEIRLAKDLNRDIKAFLRKEQAQIRKEQAIKQKRFLEEIRLEKKLESFRERESNELKKLEKFALDSQREDYKEIQERIEKLKQKYRDIRNQKIKERVEALGLEVKEGEDREALLERERQYAIGRQKIETTLESFYRSSASLCFQINKRYIPKHKSILRCIDRRYETGEIYIRWDDSPEEDWLLLIYIKNNSPSEGIVLENKTNPEKHTTHEFKSSEIFRCSDLMVDSLVSLLERERKQKAS